ncbi:hypothetical protein [Bacillus weihaiensis]|uniref:hypothetical protein n=1 Tax=Bacillus weihaiensis TaxID=1547283 RepID=UPI0013149941|nr:hypothetical protein [Bacillus weihaiensis]
MLKRVLLSLLMFGFFTIVFWVIMLKSRENAIQLMGAAMLNKELYFQSEITE